MHGLMFTRVAAAPFSAAHSAGFHSRGPRGKAV